MSPANYSKNNIPKIEQRIERLLGRLHVKPSIGASTFVKLHKGRKHRYAAVCTNPQGKKVLFYARLHNNRDAYNKFRHEILFLRALEKRRVQLTRFTPSMFTSSLAPQAEWFTRQYLTTPVLGSIHLAQRPLVTSDARRFVELFSALQNIPYSHDVASLEHRGADFYLSSIEGCLKNQLRQLPRPLLLAVKRMFHQAYLLLDRSPQRIVHGDCHPGNILLDRKHLFIIDWELLHFDTRVNDLAYFYAGLAHAPAFRKKLLASFERSISWKHEFRSLFPLSAVFFASHHLCSLAHGTPEGITPAQAKDVRRYALAIVKHALSGYTTLARL